MLETEFRTFAHIPKQNADSIEIVDMNFPRLYGLTTTAYLSLQFGVTASVMRMRQVPVGSPEGL